MPDKTKTPFDRLVALLSAHGYTVKVSSSPRYATRTTNGETRLVKMKKKHDYRFAKVTGKSIEAGFCEPNDGNSYRYIDGKIAADNADCFDKWSKCPLCLEFPATPDQEAKLLALLEHPGSGEGYALSNGYNYLGEGNNPYHY